MMGISTHEHFQFGMVLLNYAVFLGMWYGFSFINLVKEKKFLGLPFSSYFHNSLQSIGQRDSMWILTFAISVYYNYTFKK